MASSSRRPKLLRATHHDHGFQAYWEPDPPIEIELPAMLAFCSFPEEWFNEANLYHEDVKRLDTIVLTVDENVFAVKKAGAIAATRMIISTNKTHNNLECTHD